MARAIRRSSVDPRMFRHFAAGTLVVTLLLALFTQDDEASLRPLQTQDKQVRQLAKLGEGRISPLFKSMPAGSGGWANDSAPYGAPMDRTSTSGTLTGSGLSDPASFDNDPDFIPTEEELLMLGLTLEQFRALPADQRIGLIRKLMKRRQDSLLAASIARSGNDAAYRDLIR